MSKRIEDSVVLEMNRLHIEEGMSIGDLNIMFGYPKESTGITNLFSRRGLKRNINYRKGSVHYPRYFKCIDTEAKAYLLGYIIADGCIYKGSLQITSIDYHFI